MGKRSSVSKFPVARIKKIMQTNEDVGKVAQATPVVVSKALEMFMQSIVDETVRQARDKGSRKLTSQHLKRAIHENETFDFLKDIVAGVADATEEKGEGDGSRATKKRKTVSKVEEEPEEEPEADDDEDEDEESDQ
ncbi:histone-fold-containing protein [Acaromyces ingoldii]|uniref:Histone-fold-containing protein n=1 Tax=Acaromyces ingoldii TaxID=215250 RepID=A0A316YJA6_9BASI|nr:histone-fold-containing protein [Acaromyces ingoldii]PWN87805.1 histone-fold-containing protein [Acaromyces ingoldii]